MRVEQHIESGGSYSSLRCIVQNSMTTKQMLHEDVNSSIMIPRFLAPFSRLKHKDIMQSRVKLDSGSQGTKFMKTNNRK